MSRLPVLVNRPARAPRGAERQRAARALRDARHLLDDGLCAVCRERDDAAQVWLRYFTTHNHGDAATRARVQASMGFCAPHVRHLLGDIASLSWLLPQVYDMALSGGLRLLTGGTGERPDPCPACVTGAHAAHRALSILLRALDRPQVYAAVLGGGVCLPHLAEAATRLPGADGAHLAEAIATRLTETAADAVHDAGTDDDAPAREIAWLAGPDPDVPARARLHRGLDPLVDEEDWRQQFSVLDRWDADVRLACCPLCLAGHRAARRLLRWAAWASAAPPAREDTALCSRHLHDLVADGGPNVPGIVADNRDFWQARLTRFRKLRLQGGRRAATASLLSGPDIRGCRACREERLAVDRQRELLTAALGDPSRARAFESAHGVCLHHALAWDEPPAAVRSTLGARTALLRWELDEALRKQEWHTRHEVRGAEMGVGLRAPTLIDGRVYAGMPPQPRAVAATAAPEPEDRRPVAAHRLGRAPEDARPGPRNADGEPEDSRPPGWEDEPEDRRPAGW